MVGNTSYEDIIVEHNKNRWDAEEVLNFIINNEFSFSFYELNEIVIPAIKEEFELCSLDDNYTDENTILWEKWKKRND